MALLCVLGCATTAVWEGGGAAGAAREAETSRAVLEGMSSGGGGKWTPPAVPLDPLARPNLGCVQHTARSQAPSSSTSPRNRRRSRKSKRNYEIKKSLENRAILARSWQTGRQVANGLHNVHGWHNHAKIARVSGSATRILFAYLALAGTTDAPSPFLRLLGVAGRRVVQHLPGTRRPFRR